MIPASSNFINRQWASTSSLSAPKTTQQQVPSQQNVQKTQKKGLSKETINMLIDIGITSILMGAFILIPTLLQKKNNPKSRELLSMLGENLTNVKTTKYKNGAQKIFIEKDEMLYKNYEIMFINPNGKVYQRNLTCYEKRPDNKLFLRRMKCYKGKDLFNNEEIEANESKYLFKEFRRSSIVDNCSTTYVKTGKNPAKRYKGFYTRHGKPVLTIKETPQKKEISAYLYEGSNCVGIDKEIVFPNNPQENYRVLNIPRDGILNKKYSLEQDGKQYSDKLTEKLRQNF